MIPSHVCLHTSSWQCGECHSNQQCCRHSADSATKRHSDAGLSLPCFMCVNYKEEHFCQEGATHLKEAHDTVTVSLLLYFFSFTLLLLLALLPFTLPNSFLVRFGH